MKYKVGDKVRVIPDLSLDHKYGIPLNPEMLQYKNKLFTISNIESYYYEMFEDNGHWGWSEDMLVDPSHTTMKKEKVSLGRWSL